MPVNVSEGEVELSLRPQLDAIERVLQGRGELRVADTEAGARLSGQTTIAEEQPEGVRIHRDRLGLKLDRLTHERQFEPSLLRDTDPIDHLSRLDDAPRLSAPAVTRGGDVPEMLEAAQRRCSVL